MIQSNERPLLFQAWPPPHMVQPWPQHTGSLSLDNMHHHLPPGKHPILHLIVPYLMTKKVDKTPTGMNKPYNKPFTGKYVRAASVASEMCLFIQSHTLPRGRCWAPQWSVYFSAGDSLVHIHLQLTVLEMTQSKKKPMPFHAWPPHMLQPQPWHTGSLSLENMHHHLPPEKHPILHLIVPYLMTKKVHKTLTGPNNPYNEPFTGNMWGLPPMTGLNKPSNTF